MHSRESGENDTLALRTSIPTLRFLGFIPKTFELEVPRGAIDSPEVLKSYNSGRFCVSRHKGMRTGLNLAEKVLWLGIPDYQEV